jgi:hypothetical protein
LFNDLLISGDHWSDKNGCPLPEIRRLHFVENVSISDLPKQFKLFRFGFNHSDRFAVYKQDAISLTCIRLIFPDRLALTVRGLIHFCQNQ